MKLLYALKSLPELTAGTVATIGNFDGVHLGHQALLVKLKEKAKQLGLPFVVVLFEPQPGEYFQGAQAPARLSSLREKIQMLSQLGVDSVLCLRFNQQLAQASARDFAKHYLFETLNCRYLIVGEDFHFGYQRQGNFALLESMAPGYNCIVEAFPNFIIHDSRVSSTKIREALAEGKLAEAERLAGRPYSICSRVIKGDGRGRQWGIPTANLVLNRPSLALHGVFCVKVKKNQQWFQGVANLGKRPTIGGIKNLLEVHLFDVNEFFYGEFLQVFFLDKLRDEIKFNAITDLIDQIHQDIKTARHYFHEKNFPDSAAGKGTTQQVSIHHDFKTLVKSYHNK